MLFYAKLTNFPSNHMLMEQRLEGGFRFKGQSPGQIPDLPVVSVITVVFNSVGLLEKTINSVLGQTYPNIEYLVIDGGSTDGTVDLIRKYDDRVAYWLSEPDRGLYDAMNKGLAAASGDLVWFLNSGDLVYQPDTLEKIFNNKTEDGRQETKDSVLSPPLSLIYYGDTMIVDAAYREVGLRRLRPPEQLTWRSFQKGMLVCHQAILVHRTIAEPFDLKYRHSADFDWVLKALKRAWGQEGIRAWGHKRLRAYGHKGMRAWGDEGISVSQLIVNTHMVLCAFLDGGHSKQNIPASLRERFDIMRRNYGLIPTLLRHVRIAGRFLWYLGRNRRF